MRSRACSPCSGWSPHSSESASPADAVPTRVGRLAQSPTPVLADEPLAHALHDLLSAEGTGVPVLDAEHGVPVGWLGHQSALRAVHAST
ncbi:hypothetical protein [Streptomyces sp. NPDC005244]|uniref:hypothetical protein n=1 Tax=Streptomyces sp. NPDC005244 TaxID=3364708 RepID=UPI00368DC5FF